MKIMFAIKISHTSNIYKARQKMNRPTGAFFICKHIPRMGKYKVKIVKTLPLPVCFFSTSCAQKEATLPLECWNFSATARACVKSMSFTSCARSLCPFSISQSESSGSGQKWTRMCWVSNWCLGALQTHRECFYLEYDEATAWKD